MPEPFFNKVAGLRLQRKKRTLAQVFSCEFCEISKNTFFTEQLWTTASVAQKVGNASLFFQLNVVEKATLSTKATLSNELLAPI